MKGIKGFNDKLAVVVTNAVGTIWCAYLFAIVGIMGVVGALTNNVKIVLIIGAVSGYFLQLVLLPIIIVGQNIQANKSRELHAKVDKIHAHLGVK